MWGRSSRRTVTIVFKPRREELRTALQKNMPDLLTGPKKEKTAPRDLKKLLAGADKENAWEMLQKMKSS